MAGAVAGAEAADLPGAPATMTPEMAFIFDWSGHYVGGHLGSFDGDFAGGGQIGYNWQNGHTVYGVEASASFGGDIDWLAMFRGKIGYAFDYPLFTNIIPLEGHITDHFMIYVIGGLATGDISGGSDTGWTIGAGVEKRFWDHLSLTLEYDYFDLGGSDDDGHIFKAGLNFRRLWN